MSMETALIIGLVRRRHACGLSQAQMAKLMGTSQSAVARFETGKHDPRLSTLAQYAKVVGVSLNLAVTDKQPAARKSGGRPRLPRAPEPGPLTWRQRKILQVIRESVQKRGYSPSMREIAEAAGLSSSSTVSYQLRILQDKGELYRKLRQSRSIRLAGE